MYACTEMQYGASSSDNQHPLTQSAVRVLAVIVELDDEGGGLSMTQLAQMAGIGRRSVARAIAQLERRALIEVERGDCSGVPNRYRGCGFVKNTHMALVPTRASGTSASLVPPSASGTSASSRAPVDSKSACARVVNTTSSLRSEVVDVVSLRSTTSTTTDAREKKIDVVELDGLDAFEVSQRIQDILGIKPHCRWSQDWMMRGTSCVAAWLRGDNAPTVSEILEATRREAAKLLSTRGDSDVGTGWLRKAIPGHVASIRVESAPLDIPPATSTQRAPAHPIDATGRIKIDWAAMRAESDAEASQ